MNGILLRVGRLAAVVAAVIACQGHWMALQGVAWCRMLVEYSRADTIAGAIEKTFDGEHPCPMCRKIQADRQAERNEAAPGSPAPARSMLELMCLPASAELPGPSWRTEFARAGEALHPAVRSSRPPTPPPRRCS